MSTPATKICLCKGVPLNNRYDHTIYFTSAAEQNTYFTTKVCKTYTAYAFVRRAWKLKVDATFEEARQWSYLFYQNGTGKKYYYFITSTEYINDSTVELALQLDVLQSYMFDWHLNPCYVEREHSITDNIGDNTVDEGLDVGTMINAKKDCVNLSALTVLIASTISLPHFVEQQGASTQGITGAFVDGICGGFDVSGFNALLGSDYINDFRSLMTLLADKGKMDAIFSMWMYPRDLIEFDAPGAISTSLKRVSGAKSKSITPFMGSLTQPTTFDGYTPKNKKLYQYPYSFMYATNNNGGACVYRYELFKNHTPGFMVEGNISPDAIVKLIPQHYKCVDANIDEALAMSNYPLCSTNTDVYKMWLAQNQSRQALSVAGDLLKIVGGATAIASGAGAVVGGGAVTSGLTGITSQLAQANDMEIQPPQARGNFSGSHNVSRGQQNFDIYHRTLDRYHAEMIDNYFTMFGYACRKIKIPNISARPAFNFVKTVGANITGDFCQEDLRQINTIFDSGITFWRSEHYGNYSADNAPE